ncbi:recombinase family protein [uncultured Williamsia sp.]|uniref:recombinase family protein n=1 Tax=uncultured Williamsia sp. TaxID=259311 RepID=UPI002626C423|nr:recombinase family protein [uncultured Williamsia sp.]
MSRTDCVIYTRISQDRAGEQGGVERQQKDCRALADQLGVDVVKVFTDNDVSAYSGRPRPGYTDMLRLVESGAVGVVLAWHVDRLYRSIPDLSQLVEVCAIHNVAIHTVKAGPVDLTTSSGRMAATMFASVARYEVERSAERIKAAKSQQARDGKFRGGPRPFGYTRDGMELIPEEADLIRQAAAHVLAGGSLMSVTKRWKQAGVKTARGRDEFTVSSLRRILIRARNAGLVEEGGRIIGPALWPAIFDEDTLHAVRAVIADPKRRTAVSYERQHQGSGVYRCGKCGGPMKVFKGSGNGRDYRCVATPHLSQRKEPLDNYISDVVIARLSRPDAAAVFVERVDIDTAALQIERDALQARKNELSEMFGDGYIDGQQMRRGSTAIQTKIDRLDKVLMAARQSSPLADLLSSDDIADRWAAMSADVRNKIIDSLMTVTINPLGSGRRAPDGLVVERVEIAWKA